MPIFEDNHKNTIFQLNKENFPIGIFGSFKYGRLAHLQNLRNFLISNDYYAYLSEDIDPHFHNRDYQKPIGYDLKISKELVDTKKIHIFVFYRERVNEHYTTDSPGIELSYLHTRIESGFIKNPKIIILTQNGIEKEVGGLLRDLILDKRYWRHYSFKKNLESIYEYTLMRCNNFIRSDF